eukprot:1349377-Amorphochlora_amoeboformis.AAC.2
MESGGVRVCRTDEICRQSSQLRRTQRNCLILAIPRPHRPKRKRKSRESQHFNLQDFLCDEKEITICLPQIYEAKKRPSSINYASLDPHNLPFQDARQSRPPQLNDKLNSRRKEIIGRLAIGVVPPSDPLACPRDLARTDSQTTMISSSHLPRRIYDRSHQRGFPFLTLLTLLAALILLGGWNGSHNLGLPASLRMRSTSSRLGRFSVRAATPEILEKAEMLGCEVIYKKVPGFFGVGKRWVLASFHLL